jgi:outer membrane protein assembly factor BamE (lipoprotein component of BamABCDE complex)
LGKNPPFFEMSVKVLVHEVLLDKFLKWVCVFSIVIFGACATIGKPFDESHVKDLKKGTTTKLQVLEILGLPFKEGVENGLDIWTYFEKENSLFSRDLQKDLVISFDKNNVVKSFRYSSTNP